MSRKFVLAIATGIMLVVSIAVLGCMGAQTTSNGQNSGGAASPTVAPTSSGIQLPFGGDNKDLLAPYKNADGSFKKDVKITDDSINSTFNTGILTWVFFTATHPNATNLDTNTTTDPGMRMSISMYQGKDYRSLVVNLNNVKDKKDSRTHNYDVKVIVRETGDEPAAYVTSATLDGKDILPVYPTEGLFVVPTRLTIPADKILDN